MRAYKKHKEKLLWEEQLARGRSDVWAVLTSTPPVSALTIMSMLEVVPEDAVTMILAFHVFSELRLLMSTSNSHYTLVQRCATCIWHSDPCVTRNVVGSLSCEPTVAFQGSPRTIGCIDVLLYGMRNITELRIDRYVSEAPKVFASCIAALNLTRLTLSDIPEGRLLRSTISAPSMMGIFVENCLTESLRCLTLNRVGSTCGHITHAIARRCPHLRELNLKTLVHQNGALSVSEFDPNIWSRHGGDGHSYRLHDGTFAPIPGLSVLSLDVGSKIVIPIHDALSKCHNLLDLRISSGQLLSHEIRTIGLAAPRLRSLVAVFSPDSTYEVFGLALRCESLHPHDLASLFLLYGVDQSSRVDLWEDIVYNVPLSVLKVKIVAADLLGYEGSKYHPGTGLRVKRDPETTKLITDRGYFGRDKFDTSGLLRVRRIFSAVTVMLSGLHGEHGRTFNHGNFRWENCLSGRLAGAAKCKTDRESEMMRLAPQSYNQRRCRLAIMRHIRADRTIEAHPLATYRAEGKFPNAPMVPSGVGGIVNNLFYSVHPRLCLPPGTREHFDQVIDAVLDAFVLPFESSDSNIVL